MENVLIFYNNDDLLYLVDRLEKIYQFKNFFIVKTGERSNEKNYNGNVIYNLDEIQVKNILFSIAFVISESPFVNKIYFELHQLGIDVVYTLNAEYLSIIDQDDINEIQKIITCLNIKEKATIGYLETHLYNQCNLNCKGCTHFSNIDKSNMITLEEYENNISKLSRLYNVNTFRLMGGEPLLNKNLSNYIEITRKYFPNSNIDIATNGLLICNMSKELIEKMKKNNIVIKISLYLPIEKIKPKVNNFLKDNGLLYFYGNGCKQADDELLIREFHKCLSLEKQYDSEYNANNCFARECWFLKGNFICKCAIPLQSNILNEHFNTNFKLEESDYLDLTKIENGSWDDIKKLLSPISFCSYCSPKEQKFKWEAKPQNQNLYDYIIEEEE